MNLLFLILVANIPILLLYWIFPRYYSELICLGGTLLLMVYSPVSIISLTTTTIIHYLLLTRIPNKRLSVILTISLVAVLLGGYKVLETTNTNILTLVGLSYYSFKQIHVAIENYKNTLPIFRFPQYVSFLFFAPTLVVGPINKFQDFLNDANRLRWNSQLFSFGLERIVYGLFKVSFLANYLINTKVDEFTYYLENIGFSKTALYIDIIAFTTNSYLQFSGFSDVAIGLSALFGFRIIENFNYPFLASNISDFWKRWHISLSEWCMNYIFYPLLAKSRNVLFSILASMTILGLWHEISIKYIVWGAFQAIGIFVWNKYKITTVHSFLDKYRVNKYLGIVLTIHFVVFSFYVLKEDSLLQYFETVKTLFSL